MPGRQAKLHTQFQAASFQQQAQPFKQPCARQLNNPKQAEPGRALSHVATLFPSYHTTTSDRSWQHFCCTLQAGALCVWGHHEPGLSDMPQYPLTGQQIGLHSRYQEWKQNWLPKPEVRLAQNATCHNWHWVSSHSKRSLVWICTKHEAQDVLIQTTTCVRAMCCHRVDTK